MTRSTLVKLAQIRAARAALLSIAAVTLSLSGFSAIASAANVEYSVSERTVRFKSPRMPTGTNAKSAVVMDAETGRMLWALRPNQRRLIASTTKIMTALVAISRTRPNELLTATAYPAGPGESLLGLKPSERMTAKDLLTGLMLASGNDAADTLAARTATSRAAFVRAMNRRARTLGLRGTLFGNPVGLDVPETYSTASDLAKLTQHALTEPRFANIVGKSKATLRSGARTRRISNRNRLVGRYSYVDGVKTGRTLAAGYVLVGAASREDARVISVVTGEPSETERDKDTLKLLRFGRAFYRPVEPLSRDRGALRLPVALQDITAVAYPQRDVRFAVRSGDRLRVTAVAPDELKGPLAAGTRVGTATVFREGERVADVPLRLRRAVPSPPTLAVVVHQIGKALPYVAILGLIGLLGFVIIRRRRLRTHRPEYVG
ncbi:MAG: D-alanyl-D-alanine carboxypeptidase family protein [Solirubrobacterales bacterium]